MAVTAEVTETDVRHLPTTDAGDMTDHVPDHIHPVSILEAIFTNKYNILLVLISFDLLY